VRRSRDIKISASVARPLSVLGVNLVANVNFVRLELQHSEFYACWFSLELNSGVACTASVVGGWVGFWGGKGSDLAIQVLFPPQEKYTKS